MAGDPEIRSSSNWLSCSCESTVRWAIGEIAMKTKIGGVFLLVAIGSCVSCTTTTTTHRTGENGSGVSEPSATVSSTNPTIRWSFPEEVRLLYPATPRTTESWERIKGQMPSIWRATSRSGPFGSVDAPSGSHNHVELRVSPESGAVEMINFTNSDYGKRGDLLYVADDSDGRWGSAVSDIHDLSDQQRSSLPRRYWEERPSAIQVISEKSIKHYMGHMSGVPTEQTLEYVSSRSEFLGAEADQQFASYSALQRVPLPSVWESTWDPESTDYINGYIRLTLSADDDGSLLLKNTDSEPDKFAQFPAPGAVIFRGSGPRTALGTLNLYDPSAGSVHVPDETLEAIASFMNGRGELKFPDSESLQLTRNGKVYPFRFVSGIGRDGLPVYPANISRKEVNARCETWSFNEGMEFEDYKACVINNSRRDQYEPPN